MSTTTTTTIETLNRIIDEIEQVNDSSTPSLIRLRDLYAEALRILKTI